MANEPWQMSPKQIAFIRDAYIKAGIEATDDQLNRIMHKQFMEYEKTQWYEISRERAHHWIRLILAAQRNKAKRDEMRRRYGTAEE